MAHRLNCQLSTVIKLRRITIVAILHSGRKRREYDDGRLRGVKVRSYFFKKISFVLFGGFEKNEYLCNVILNIDIIYE